MSNKDSTQSYSWDEIYQHKNYKEMVIKKQSAIIKLLIISLIFFFSIPFMNSFFPDLMKVKIAGAVNIGLVWAILQYPLGGLIACRYAVKMRHFDRESKKLSQFLNGYKNEETNKHIA
ncbi:DUF485 domain-containing protein [Brenneria goodwinii]|uniref:DUF485 domain-containing protein n=1 Tax=Brenneria goodwinii TaxID=1109412 RepID=UPI000EF242FE|nr:DUF485 domain-containing protein [Brenneria goodwinii]MCG8156380.1 DUF485 domain-containing protein [Brenneria goodwinii]MCG8160881.1 DUF485 domain-containing protein [Brenneria goodwinii]MCG8166194.1 DUF485 domain-containing protein [Brenneria goodwinii]MCG8169718.1 DUF485 domain-containing protein [Brenneria goodwinii]MCG8175039.1 DUF485 domain-containing protein [Brenneria goodwinii]